MHDVMTVPLPIRKRGAQGGNESCSSKEQRRNMGAERGNLKEKTNKGEGAEKRKTPWGVERGERAELSPALV